MANKKLKIIGLQGVNASGKSTLSHSLAKDYLDYDTVATDNLLAINRLLNPQDDRIHCSSYSSWERFGEPSLDNLWKGFSEYRESNLPFLKCILDRARAQKVGMIIEGVHIEPELFKSYENELDVYIFLLGINNEDVHKSRIIQKCDYRPTLLKRLNDYFPRIRDLQFLLTKEANKYNIPIIETGVSEGESLIQIKHFLR